ncbi:cache domain-containing protein [Halopseudomonas bauzanensis]|uniref:Cytochrome c n=1 Tax=Halopseudomonas bauzanensis TaxID=653930 RepID=A0A1H9U378_9GAMM|nr:cache domain-containing protein [Halopseudomonas bauzanensis]SES03829.1 cytochrome c [Halopseudomonas bauzanensis]SFM04658.1 cytochrome c [Halopseudomonas bauzanensis]
MLLICRNVALVATMFLIANVFGQGIPEDRYADEADRAKSLLRKAVDHYQENGEKAIAAFSRQGEFMDDELYVYVIDTEGIMLASGGPSANLIGRDVSQALNDDLNKGFKEALALPPSDTIHHADYRWHNWQDGREERKRVFFQRVGGKVFSVGYYMPRSSEGEAKALLNNVVEAVKENSQQTFERINKLDAKYLRDDLYAFVVDRETQRFIAHGYNLRLVGSDFRKLHSADRHPIGNQILEATAQSGSGRIPYLWPNPVTRKNEPKVTLFEATDSYIVAVGYYLDEEQ